MTDSLPFLPDLRTFLAYNLACFLLFITPGPDMSFFLAKTVEGGRKAGIVAMMGACTGNLVHSLAAAFGLSALIAASTSAFTAVKIVGAVYLLYMAYGAIRHGSALNIAQGESTPSLWRIYLNGIGINLANPKVILFFITFLPQFVTANDAYAAQKLLFLGFYFVFITFPMAVGLIYVADGFIEKMRSSPKIMRRIDYTFGAIFGLFALQILFTQGRS